MEDPHVPEGLTTGSVQALEIDIEQATYFLSSRSSR
jgi:hypothetical protein